MIDQTPSEMSGALVSAAIDSDAELHAIRAVLGALVPLKNEGRTRVLDYILKRFRVLSENLPPGNTSATSHTHSVDAYVTSPTSEARGETTDIRSLTKEKAPRSANEMAALVAYYLTELAPQEYRKRVINADDIRTYFKQATFPLPSSAKMTLVNAKNSGYLESAGTGQYKLNPVGYNLVVHGLPGASSKKTKPQGPRKKTTSKRTRKNKTSRKSK